MLDKKFFNENYFKTNLTFRDIAEKTDYSVGTIYRAFKKLGLKPKTYIVWNKGISCFEDQRILSGENHPRWKNKSKYYIEFKKQREKLLIPKTKCEKCGKKAILLHHKDFNTTNNSTKNLQPLCNSCHTTLHNLTRGRFKKEFKCAWCNKHFIIYSRRNANSKFCSLSCKSNFNYHKGNSGIKNSPSY